MYVSDKESIVIASGVRTAIGSFGGALKNIPPTKLASLVISEAIKQAQLDASDIEQVVLGNVIHTEPEDMYISRVAAVDAGIPYKTPALTLNRLCGSGMQAIISAYQMLLLGDGKIAVAGGAENMSRSGHLLPSLRRGHRMGDAAAVDMMTGALTCPFGNGHMGVTAENIAERFNITRIQQDEFALLSQKRAHTAIEADYFKSQILPIEVGRAKNSLIFDVDEHVRMNANIEDFSKLTPVFKKDGSVTAGNASGINDAAAAIVLMREEEALARSLQPMAKIVSYGHAGVDPAVMGLGPIGAVNQALQRANLTINNLDVIESNEAFAAQAIAVSQELNFDTDKVNPNGGAIALGHPIGASGTILVVKLIHELHRSGGKYGLATMCIGGGQGIAIIIKTL